ncbi:MAG: energy-coupling factor ABC transporter permease [Methanomassiliicoccales archaeon]
MHIPDGLMAPLVWVTGWGLAAIFISLAVLKVNRTLDERIVPFMAILAAGIFVAQMLNFPIVGGTTGHLIGAALATIMVGPWGAVLIITVILLIQGFIFGDGGITALGLNILNMAVVGVSSAYLIIRLTPQKFQYPAFFLAAWLSVFLAASACAIQLALSFALDPSFGIEGSVSIPAMMISHAVIGIGEGIITVGVVAFLSKVAPETMNLRELWKKEVST